jgi:hypothetical protein
VRQHSMLGIAAAFANPHAGPSWNTSTPSSKSLTNVRTLNTLALITLAGNLFFFSYATGKRFPAGTIFSRQMVPADTKG